MNRYIRQQIVLGESENVDKKHIVLCGDKLYIKYCGVTLTSVLLSNPQDNFVFHIFCDDVSEDDLKLLKDICKKFKTSIFLYKLDINFIVEMSNNLNPDMGSISVATFFRLIAFEVLSGYASKALYLDSDMLVVGKIAYLWNLDMEDFYAVVVRIDIGAQHQCRIGVQKYFNAGMVFCDIEKWNKNNFTDCCLEYVLKEKPEWMDQDALNKAFGGNCIYLDNRWNFLVDLETVINNENTPSKSDFVINQRELKIIHFVGRNKPWCHWCQCIPIVKKYMSIVKQSMWKNLKVHTVEDIKDLKYRYKHTRMEFIVSTKERRLEEAILWGVKYIIYKLIYKLKGN